MEFTIWSCPEYLSLIKKMTSEIKVSSFNRVIWAIWRQLGRSYRSRRAFLSPWSHWNSSHLLWPQVRLVPKDKRFSILVSNKPPPLNKYAPQLISLNLLPHLQILCYLPQGNNELIIKDLSLFLTHSKFLIKISFFSKISAFKGPWEEWPKGD